MAIVPDFRVVTQENAQKAFHDRFALLRKIKLEEGETPSADIDKELYALFRNAYPDNNTYVQSAFSEPIALAGNIGIKIPLPAPEILDTQKELMAGMGNSFFHRLIYLQNLANKSIADVEEKILLAAPPTLPSLQLVMASDIFNAIRIESSNQLMRNLPPEPTGLKASLKSLVNGASQPGMQSGYVVNPEISSLTSGGVRKVVTIVLEDIETSEKPRKLLIEGPDKDSIKAGDLIGVVGVKKAGDGLLSASHMAILVPIKISAFLKRAEPDFTPIPSTVRELIVTSDDPHNPEFKYGDVLSNDSQGTLIFGRVMSFDDRARTITIKDKDNRQETVRIDVPFDNFGLEQGSIFIARPTQLGKDGIYKIIPKETMKLDAPYAGRLLMTLPKIAPMRVEANEGIDFTATEPMPR